MDIKEAVNLLVINEHDLTAMLIAQAPLVYQVGEEVRRCERTFDVLSDDAKRLEGAVFATRKAASEADKLATENARNHPGVVEAWHKALEASQELKQWRNVAEALKQKGYSLKELVTLHTVEYYGLTPAGAGPRVGSRTPRKDYTEPPATPAPRSLRQRVKVVD